MVRGPVLPQAYAILDPKLQVIYGIVPATSEVDAIGEVISDNGLLFDGDQGAREIDARLVEQLRDDFWYEVAPLGPGPAADCGGDVQVSDALGRRFAHPRHADKDWAVVDVRWYVADDSEYAGSSRRLGRYLELQVEYAHCTDLRDVGGTGTWADGRHLIEHDFPATMQGVRAAAERYDGQAEICWNGEML